MRGLCFAVMALGENDHRLGLLCDGATQWLAIPDDALRAEIWRLLGCYVEVTLHNEIAVGVALA